MGEIWEAWMAGSSADTRVTRSPTDAPQITASIGSRGVPSTMPVPLASIMAVRPTARR
jgi:hypothetical protein